MNSIEGNSLFNFVSSLGWVLDRTGEEEQIISTVWLTGDRQVATCAIPLIPYAETLEALIIRFPCTQKVWGVKSIDIHPGCDRWMAKRAYAQSLFFPPNGLINQQHNVAMLRLTPNIMPLDRNGQDRLHRQISKTLPQEEIGFAGRATSVELTSVIQTLVNARRQGTIVICDKRKRPIARIYCESGRISHARYGDILNEAAVYKLMCSSFSGFFYFQQEKLPEWCDFPTMTKSTAGLLLEAYRRLEDKTQALAPFGDDSANLFKLTEQPSMVDGPLAQPDAQTVWAYIHNGMPISQLVKVCELDGYETMRILNEFLTAGLIQSAPAQPPSPFGLASPALPMNTQTPVAPGSYVYAISIDPSSGPYFAPGKVLGERMDGDPWHLVHDIALPEEAMGSPIFLGSEVVGMYTGGMLQTKYDKPEYAHGQQMLWAPSIASCLGTGELKAPATSTSLSTGDNIPTLTPEIEEKIQQANAESQNGDQRTSLTNPVVTLEEAQAALARETAADTGNSSTISNIFGSISAVFSRGRRPQTSQPWFEVEVTRTELGSSNWLKASGSTVFRAGDLIRLQVKLLQDCYFYALFQSSSGKNVIMLFPETFSGPPLPKASIIGIPSRQSDNTSSSKSDSGKFSPLGLPIPSTISGGTESLLMLASKTQLAPLADKTMMAAVFVKGTIMLNGQKNLDLVEMEEKVLYEGLDVPEMLPNAIALSKLRVSHGG
ncbi:MAG TPA: DUF4388 domain-containing protein [Oculatellaceae cyanobacterium]